MRSSRLVVSLAAVVAAGLAPSPGAAQSATQGFADSWYWGAYGGASTFATMVGGQNWHKTAPVVGAEWVLTRSRFALNLFVDQSYFTTLSSIASPTSAALLPVNIADLRRFGFAVMMFTPEYKAAKPYFGVGYSFNYINTAALRGSGTFPTEAAADSNQKAIVNAQAMARPFGNVGVMFVLKRFAPFAQFTVMPTQGNQSWYLNGSGFTMIWSAGLRYNFGTSIEKW